MQDRAELLLVDDERGITDFLVPILEREGYAVQLAHDGKSALSMALDRQFDLIILDVLLPGLNGREVCRQLRAVDNWTPILMLTRLDQTLDKVLGLQQGADDYLSKPFDTHELIARINARLRRSQRQIETLSAGFDYLKADELLFDSNAKRIIINNQLVALTPKALLILEHLMLHPERVFSREQLMNAVWGWAQSVASRAVDIRIAEIRQALKVGSDQREYIETVFGFGYSFIVPVKKIKGKPVE